MTDYNRIKFDNNTVKYYDRYYREIHAGDYITLVDYGFPYRVVAYREQDGSQRLGIDLSHRDDLEYDGAKLSEELLRIAEKVIGG